MCFSANCLGERPIARLKALAKALSEVSPKPAAIALIESLEFLSRTLIRMKAESSELAQ